MQQSFVLEYWPDGDWLVGRLRGVPGVFSQGRTLEELKENVREAYQLMMADEEDVLENVQTVEVVFHL